MDSIRQLEWELSLSSSELISHGWYRGSMGRAAAESELEDDGHFLVRDSASQPGNYVLSCRHAGLFLHFVINRVVIQPDTVYERFQYQFEDEPYDTVPDLVTSYVGSGKPISMASGARIQRPSNRSYPLTASFPTNQTMPHSGSRPSDLFKELRTFSSKYNSLDRTHRGPQHEDTNYSNDGTNLSNQHNQDLVANVVALSLSNAPSYHTCRRKTGETDEEGNECQIKPNEQSSWDGWEGVQVSPPAKPARVQQPGYQTSGSDSGNGSGDSHSSGPGETHSQHSNTRPVHDPFKPQIHLKIAEENVMRKSSIEFTQVSSIDVENFRSALFPSQHNKPLEVEVLQIIKTLLRTSGPRILASHMTYMDMKLFIKNRNIQDEENCNPLEDVDGLELCLLPHGQQIRLDIIERVECLKLLIAVTILTSQSDSERADVLNDWIQLAIEVKTALGNLFAFSVIMLGLSMPQVECLEATWFKLRQKYTEAAFTFEAKLRPCFKSMNDGTDPAPPNTTIPHLLPIIMYIHNADERSKPEIDTTTTSSVDFGLSTLASHMEMARKYPDQIPMYRQNAKTVVQELSSLGSMFDMNLLELFKTEFHIRFLWGSRGATVAAQERHSRLTQVLMTMAQKYPTMVAE